MALGDGGIAMATLHAQMDLVAIAIATGLPRAPMDWEAIATATAAVRVQTDWGDIVIVMALRADRTVSVGSVAIDKKPKESE